jgi:dTMP kinase
MVQMSLFISFEGIEGCGKTTQIRLLADRLRRSGLEVLVTREPGGCPIADAIRGILLHPGSSALVPRAELLLYAAARAQHVDEVIRPALTRGTLVLCDRFIDATVAYQGGGRGLDPSLIASLNTLATDGLLPNLTLLLDMPAEEGLQRARQRNAASPEEDRFERETLDFHRRVRNGYLQLARQHERFMVIDATGSVDTVAERIGKAVDATLMQKGAS